MKPSFTGTLKESLSLIRRYLKEIAIISLFNAILIYVIQTLLLVLVKHMNPIVSWVVLNLVITSLSLFNTALIVIFIVSREALQSIPISKIFQYISTRFIPLIVTSFLYEIVIFIGVLLFIIPGLLFFVAYSQALNFALIDGDNPIVAFKNSWQVTRGKRLQLMGLTLVFGILYGIISIPGNVLNFPQYIQLPFSSILFNIAMITNYVIWKTLKMPPVAEVKKGRGGLILLGVFLLFLILFISYKYLPPLFSPAGGVHRVGEVFYLNDKKDQVTIMPENIKIKLVNVTDTRAECSSHECFVPGSLNVTLNISQKDSNPPDITLQIFDDWYPEDKDTAMIGNGLDIRLLDYIDFSKAISLKVEKDQNFAPQTTPIPTPTPAKKIADSQTPASGVCESTPSGWHSVSFTITIDAVQPRCKIVSADDYLTLINKTDKILHVSFGKFSLQIEPGMGREFQDPFGSYLEPGVHVMQISPYPHSPEIWLKK